MEDDSVCKRARKRIAVERFLARLINADPDRWMLKGGVALEFRLGDRSRMTRDLDVACFGESEKIVDDIIDAARIDLGDSFSFVVEQAKNLAVEDDIDVARLTVRCVLSGKVVERFRLDVAVEDAPDLNPDSLIGSTLLAFAGIAPVEIPTIRLERHVAEIVHAYTRVYGAGRTS